MTRYIKKFFGRMYLIRSMTLSELLSISYKFIIVVFHLLFKLDFKNLYVLVYYYITSIFFKLGFHSNNSYVNALYLLKYIEPQYGSIFITSVINSKSQILQDVFVISALKFKRGGYFVEFGATDGVLRSNSWLLEKKFSFDGILCEPAKSYQLDLAKNRNVNILDKCVFSTSNISVDFFENDSRELSGISNLLISKEYEQTDRLGLTYKVNTISLNDLMNQFNAPHNLDYLSIDTEGSEFTILNNFDFESFRPNIITVEHNHRIDRYRIKQLLESVGYAVVLGKISQWEDWFILKDSEAYKIYG